MSAAGQQEDGAPALLLAAWTLISLSWFSLALAQAGPQRPWLGSFQAFCFGSSADGLPSPWGWALLFLAPASLLCGLLASYPRELAGLWLAWRRGSWGGFLALLAAGAFLAQGAWMAQRLRQAAVLKGSFALPASEEVLPEDYPRQSFALPSFHLTDQRGRRVDPASLRGQIHVLTFAYAHCATVCPFLLRDTQEALRATPGLKGVFLTLDPWRDTPSALPDLAKRWGLGEESQLLSGDPKAVLALLKGLGVPYKRDAKTGVVDHPPLVYVLDAQGRVAYQFNHPSPGWIQEAARRLQAGA